MKFLFDENIPKKVVEHFKSNHTVYYVTDINRGISDNKVLDLALNLKAILITADKDFGGLSFKKDSKLVSIILIRISSVFPEDIIKAIEKTINNVHSFENKFIVVNDEKIRIREL